MSVVVRKGGEARRAHLEVTTADGLQTTSVDRTEDGFFVVLGRLAVIAAFAVTQPVFEAIRAGSSVLGSKAVTRAQMWIWLVEVVLVPFLVLASPPTLTRAVALRRWRPVAAVMAGIGVAMMVAVYANRAFPLVVAWMLAAVSLVVATLAFLRSESFKLFLTVMLPAPLIFVAAFLGRDPIRTFMFDAAASAASTTGASTPVVFIVFDELPVSILMDEDGNLDRDAFPGFGKLADRSTWYKYAVAPHDRSDFSVPALLSGRYPEPGDTATVFSFPDNLFTLLDHYEVTAIEPFTNLCPVESCQSENGVYKNSPLGDLSVRLFRDMLSHNYQALGVEDRYDERLMTLVNAELHKDNVGRFKEFVDDISNDPSRLYFSHLLLPHVPYRYFGSGRLYNDSLQMPGRSEGDVWIDEWSAGQAARRLIYQTKMVDGLVDGLVEQLENQAMFGEAIIVVTADHGASFRIGSGRRGVSAGNVGDIAFVPLFVSFPGSVGGEVVSKAVSLIDVVPAIIDEIEQPGTGSTSLMAGEDPPEILSWVGQSMTIEEPSELLSSSLVAMKQLTGNATHVDRIGDQFDLIGTPVANLKVENDQPLHDVIPLPWRFQSVWMDSGFLPAYVSGTVADKQVTWVALVLNGVVAATGPVMPEGEEGGFHLLIDEGFFREGRNDLALFATGDGAKWRPIITSVERYFSLDESSDVIRIYEREHLVCSSGYAPSVEGAVDSVEWQWDGVSSASALDIVLYGWAADRRSATPVDTVVFFIDDRFVGSVSPGIARPELEDHLGFQDLSRVGFLAKVSSPPVEHAHALRAFAITGANCGALAITQTARAALGAAGASVASEP